MDVFPKQILSHGTNNKQVPNFTNNKSGGGGGGGGGELIIN